MKYEKWFQLVFSLDERTQKTLRDRVLLRDVLYQ